MGLAQQGNIAFDDDSVNTSDMVSMLEEFESPLAMIKVGSLELVAIRAVYPWPSPVTCFAFRLTLTSRTSINVRHSNMLP